MDFPDKLDSNARVGVRKGTGTTYERRRVSLIEGTNVSFTVADDPTNEEVDVTVAVASAAPSGSAGGVLSGTYPNPSINVGTGVEVSSNAVRLSAAAAGAGLTGGAGSALAVGAGTGITVNADDVAIDSSVITTGAWSSWVPSHTDITVGNGTVVARYARVGRTIHFQWRLVLGSTSSIGATIARFTLPVAAATSFSEAVFMGKGFDSSLGTNYVLLPDVQSSAASDCRIVSTSGAVTTTSPFTWATGDTIFVGGTYEAAS